MKTNRRLVAVVACLVITSGGVDRAIAQLRVLPADEIAAQLPSLISIDLENLNPRTVQGPIRTGGVVFRGYTLKQCRAPDCNPDPDNTNGANVIICFNPGNPPDSGSPILFLRNPRFVVLDVQGGGAGTFRLRIRDAAGKAYFFEGESPANGNTLYGFEAAYGVRQIDVVSFEATSGGTRPLCFAGFAVHSVPTPTNLIAKPIWSTQVNLTWRYPESGQSEFKIERSTGTRSNFTEIAIVDADARSATDLSVAPNTRYFYRIRANHPNGESAYSNDAAARTPGVAVRKVFRSIGAEDGYVCETFETSNRGGTVVAKGDGGDALLVGDQQGNQQCKAFLSFETSAIPDNAQIVSAILRLREGFHSGSGDFSSLGPLYVDISSGRGFGGGATLQASDFEAANSTRVGRLRSSESGWWIGTINALGRSLISKTGRTQFRLYFAADDNNNGTAENVGFFSGDSLDRFDRPILEILYHTRTAPTRAP